MMLPVAARMDRVGFDSIDLIGGAVWDVSVRFLKEDPWERIRHVRKLITRTPINAIVRGQSLWTFEVFPNDVVELAIERLKANGIAQVAVYDQFNDLRNVEVCVAKANEVGLMVMGTLVFSWSPVHTDAYYAAKAAQFMAIGADEINLKDPSGMLSVERIRTIIPALRKAIGPAPINIHSHCMTGRAPDVLLAGVEAGADKLHTAISPLAHGASHPPAEWIHDRLVERGYTTGLDREALEEVAGYFRYACHRWDKPRGEPVEFDARVLEHQMPGGMITNLREPAPRDRHRGSARRNPARDRAGAQRHGLRAGGEPHRAVHGDAGGAQRHAGRALQDRARRVAQVLPRLLRTAAGARSHRSSWTVRCARATRSSPDAAAISSRRRSSA